MFDSSGENRPIRVLLVDDHQLLTGALSQMLSREPDIIVAGVAGSVAEAKAMARERLDVVLMDYRLPDGTGAEATRAIKARWPAARVVMLTALTDDETVLESIQAGADGYLTKDRAIDEVVSAVRAAYAGETLLPRSVIVGIAQRVAAARERGTERRQIEPLTPRELEVLKALTEGWPRRRSASVCISRRTHSGPTSRTSWASFGSIRSSRLSRSPSGIDWSSRHVPRTVSSSQMIRRRCLARRSSFLRRSCRLGSRSA
jgi:two-component system response regulator DevR